MYRRSIGVERGGPGRINIRLWPHHRNDAMAISADQGGVTRAELRHLHRIEATYVKKLRS